MNSTPFKILYIQTLDSSSSSNYILTSLLRISNYLNSRIHELNFNVDEEYLDLRFENLPQFIPENIEPYRIALKKLLFDLNNCFNFNLAAISCNGSSNYLNALEVSLMIKSINPQIITVVGGIYCSIYPEDFQTANVPKHFWDFYPNTLKPFDFLIKEEGELAFFNLIKDILCNSRNQVFSGNCINLKSEIIENLNDLPIINLNLYSKYKEKLKNCKELWIDFSRGCFYRCRFCINSLDYVPCYRKVRTKSVKKCLEELKVLKNVNWLNIKQISISDMIFLPKKSLRKEFFEEFRKLIQEEGKFPFTIKISERVEFCSNNDLDNYKEFNIIPHVGVESSSKKLLSRLKKVPNHNEKNIDKGIKNYLEKIKKIIKYSNRIGLPLVYNYLMGVPGVDKTTLQEEINYFFKKRFFRKPLIKKYHIILKLNKYIAHPGSWIYENAEKEFGTKIYYKQWWKIFDKRQGLYSSLVDPSKNFTLNMASGIYFKFLKDMVRNQRQIRNPAYSIQKSFQFITEEFAKFQTFKSILKKDY